MKFDLKFSLIILFCIFIGSCKNNAFLSYIDDCRQNLHDTDEKYYFTSLRELKEKLDSRGKLFYIGSDTTFHYLEYFTERPIKTGLAFKILFKEYEPNVIFELNENIALERTEQIKL